MGSAKAFFGGFLDGFTMAGFWKPRLSIPGAATQLFRPDPDEVDWRKRLEDFKAEVATKASKARREYEETRQRVTETAAAFAHQTTTERGQEIGMELFLLYSIAINRAKELGLDEEQMNELHASILERHRSAEKHPTY